jgi:predicted dehydrogenase/threonine dehydrogenase-like Zn-dependent dehydrogenase
MRQLLQDARTGEVTVAEVPQPQLLPGCVLVRVEASLISAGTERASSEFAGRSLFAKAKARPDLVRDVLAKLRRDGLIATLDTVRSRLDQPQSLGYSSAGTVVAVGEGVTDINVGDRVACAGAGFALHAEFACVPRLLTAKIPVAGNVSCEEAAFGTVGAVCLHGIRTAQVALGDIVAIIGLGLLGQVTVQLLRAAGCRVLGMDLLPERTELAVQRGVEAACVDAQEFRDLCSRKTAAVGVDSVLITAETPSSGPVQLAAEVARDRATVVAVGTVGMEISRKLYFEKELDFRVSRSYGPGRYDAAYEQKGRDYPIGYVRWTETRNMEAFLQLAQEGKLNLSALITHRFQIEQATRAYDLISGRTGEPFLGVLIKYGDTELATERHSAEKIGVARIAARSGSTGIGVLGAGNFSQSTLLPALKSISEVSLVGICNATGPRSRHAAQKFGFSYCTHSDSEILNDPNVGAVVIATRHHLHSRQVLEALSAGKHVFCEKPLCLTESELCDIVRAAARDPQLLLMVGFNRRFGPMALELKKFMFGVEEPLAIHYRVNAGFIPPDHWVNDPEQGGGRILGEVCHFVDFLCFLTDSCPIEVRGELLGNSGRYSMDNIVATLKFANGTVGTISYLANGDKCASKERIEVFGGGSVAILNDFRHLELVRHGRKRVMRSRWRQDKGHRAEVRAFIEAMEGNAVAPIAFKQIVGSTLATIRLHNSCQIGEAAGVEVAEFMAAALDDCKERGTAGEC